jgi:hypothetical protein
MTSGRIQDSRLNFGLAKNGRPKGWLISITFRSSRPYLRQNMIGIVLDFGPVKSVAVLMKNHPNTAPANT